MTTTRDVLQEHLRHLQLRGMSPTTLAQRQYAVLRLARVVGCDPADLLALTEDDLDGWQHTMVDRSPAHRATSAVHVRQFYKWAQTRGYVRDDPSRVLILPKIPRRVPQPIPDLDLDTALSMAPDRLRPMLVLAAYAGLRAAEIANLTREQVVDKGSPPCLVVIGKGDRQRVVPLSRPVLDELHRYGLPAEGFVCSREDGQPGPNRPDRISSLCNHYLHSLGITHSLHKLRHFYGTSMYKASRDLRMVQEVMGHSSPITTSGYVSYADGVAHTAAEAIAAAASIGQPRVRRKTAVSGARPLRALPDLRDEAG